MAKATNPPAVANPFTRGSSRMRRNTRNTKWVTFGGTIKKHCPAPGRHVQLTRQPSITDSYAASISQVESPDGTENRFERGMPRERQDSDTSVFSYHNGATISNIAEIPDIWLLLGCIAAHAEDAVHAQDAI
ncbi:hypothetical protein K458DRAFT_419119 [Lentithecium fluviatile CBS 122367]|uniref:Uncharacterized protein n=1 Tax=Lentithecium fluviatile CBS 122367 TaxID=1168545 RepID=A0A6G1IZX9_9PLEO|nr:hypothetical protein K458DRAFT_419119 [Lentithecium fluviatile CBS 122367]